MRQKFDELLSHQRQYKVELLSSFIHPISSLSHIPSLSLCHNNSSQQSVVEEEKAIEVLDQKIRDMEREISQQRKVMGGCVSNIFIQIYDYLKDSLFVCLSLHRVHGSEQQHVGLQKQLRVMENRLEKVSLYLSFSYPFFQKIIITHPPIILSSGNSWQASVRFNSSLATNSQLRMKIDHLRQEKTVFEGIHKKLQKVCTYSSNYITWTYVVIPVLSPCFLYHPYIPHFLIRRIFLFTCIHSNTPPSLPLFNPPPLSLSLCMGVQELLGCKRSIGEVIEASTQAYDTRDDAQSKLLSLKEKADKEVAQYEMEVKVKKNYHICSIKI